MKTIFLSNDDIYKLKKVGVLKEVMGFWSKEPEIGSIFTVSNRDEVPIAKVEIIDCCVVERNCYKISIKYIQKICN